MKLWLSVFLGVHRETIGCYGGFMFMIIFYLLYYSINVGIFKFTDGLEF